MKIICVIDSLGSGGAQRQLVNLAVSFRELGHEVTFITYHSSSFYESILSENEISIIQIIEPSVLKRIYRIRKAINSLNCDAVLSFLDSPNLICEIATIPRKKWKLVVGERSANPKINKSIKLKAYRFFHLLADAVVANSYANITLIKKANPLLPESKLHVIYNIIDLDQWKPRKNISRKNDKLHLIIAARHNYLKNLNGLIEAVNLLSDRDKEKLIIKWYGREDNDNSYNEAVKKIKRYNLYDIFEFCPPTLNIHQKVNESDIVGLFSFYEGLPNTVCEGMINEKVVIASNISDISRLLDAEFIFDPHNYTEISHVLSYALNLSEESRSKVAKNNRERGLALFNKQTTVQKYLDLLS